MGLDSPGSFQTSGVQRVLDARQVKKSFHTNFSAKLFDDLFLVISRNFLQISIFFTNNLPKILTSFLESFLLISTFSTFVSEYRSGDAPQSWMPGAATIFSSLFMHFTLFLYSCLRNFKKLPRWMPPAWMPGAVAPTRTHSARHCSRLDYCNSLCYNIDFSQAWCK